MQQDGLARGGPDGAGTGHRMAHERIHKGRLPCTGGTANNGQQRRVQAAVPGKDVVIQLAGGAGSFTPGLVSTWKRQRQADLRKGAPHIFQQGHRFGGLRRLGCIIVLVPGGHSNIMPAHAAQSAANDGGAPLQTGLSAGHDRRNCPAGGDF